MKIVASEDHRLHFPEGELHGGELVRPFECPERVEHVRARLAEVGLNDVVAPAPLDRHALATVHDAEFLAFLEGAWDAWRAAGYRGEAIPTTFAARRMCQRPPRHVEGRLGYYAFAAETAITAGSWAAAAASCALAQTAQRLVSSTGAGAAFALCRPPGHHAGRDLFGGYCFLNNAAVAAQMFIADGAARVAVLDVDFHHGNGTQDIFYRRGDVLFCSLHGRPEDAFPYFLGYLDETGEGPGEDCNANFPLAPGSDYRVWSAALDLALGRIRRFGAEALVVSLGVDTFKDDPISFFRLESEDYLDCGRRVATLRLPTVFVLEGGYAVAEVGVNAVNVLQGFLEG